MKIALIVPGGVDRGREHRVIPCLLWMIERLAREHELHVFALRQEPRPCSYPLLGAVVHNAGARPRRARLAVTLLREHGKRRFRLIHAVWAAPPGAIAAVLGRVLRIPVLLRLTGGDLASLPEAAYGQRASWRGRLWLRAAVAGASHITVPSSAMQSAARELGILAERLPWGVATDQWPPRRPRPRGPGMPARLLHVGTLNRVKDQTTLLYAAKRLQSEGIAFRLDIAGADLLDGEIQRLADTLDLSRQVRFHGFVPHSRLRPMMENADLLLVSSLHEADPIVCLEAAVAGVPTVGTAVGHLKTWMPDAARVAPPKDSRALAAQVAALLDDDSLRLSIASAAQEHALREDADWSAHRVLELYKTLTSG